LSANDAVTDYRGALALSAAFSELDKDYSLRTKYFGEDAAILGTPAYQHKAQNTTRQTTTIGAAINLRRPDFSKSTATVGRMSAMECELKADFLKRVSPAAGQGKIFS